MAPFYSPRFWLALAGLCALGAFAWQQRSILQLRQEIAGLRASLASESDTPRQITHVPESSPTAPPPTVRALETGSDSPLEQRVAQLEASVSLLSDGADHLMDKGTIPPSEAKLAEWSTTFFNTSATSKERLAAIRQLRRNGAFTPPMALAAANWLATSTDPGETRSLLEALRGADDPALKAVTLNLASSAADNRVRDRAILNLREYVNDPQVEAALWTIVQSDSSERLQRRAQDALGRIPMNDSRAANLEMRALNPSTTVEERLTSLRLLESGKQDIARIAPTLAQAAQGASDAETRLQFYRAFDDVNDPSFMLPLVEGTQDANVEVRLRATDALFDYRSEPAIAELLRAMAESDPDPRIRQEAARIFRDGQR